jgi:hypothetical protein
LQRAKHAQSVAGFARTKLRRCAGAWNKARARVVLMQDNLSLGEVGEE